MIMDDKLFELLNDRIQKLEKELSRLITFVFFIFVLFCIAALIVFYLSGIVFSLEEYFSMLRNLGL